MSLPVTGEVAHWHHACVTQPGPAYQPYQQPRPMTPMGMPTAPPRPRRGGLARTLAGITALLAAVLAIVGSFGTITSYRTERGADNVYGYHVGWWSFTDNGSTSTVEDQGQTTGIVLVLAATALVLAAVFAFLAARNRRAETAARSLAAAGAGVLLGAVLVHVFDTIDQMSVYNDQVLRAGESIEFRAGIGLYLPLAAAVVGIVGAVLAHLGRSEGARVEPNTPRMGFPQPYGALPMGQVGYQQPGPSSVAPSVPAAPVIPAGPSGPVPMTERPTEVAGPDDASDTQVVSEATANPAPAAGSDEVWVEGTATGPQPAAGGGTPAPSAQEIASALGGSPVGEERNPFAPPATPHSPEEPAAPAAPAMPAPPAPPAPPAAPTAPQSQSQSQSQDTPPAEPGAPGKPEAPAGPTTPRGSVTDLPAAPPPPDLTGPSDDK